MFAKSSVRSFSGGVMVAFAVVCVDISVAHAQQPEPGKFNKLIGSIARAQQPETPTAAAFLADPGQLLKQNPDGGALLAGAIQQLALSDPTTFDKLIGLMASANEMQKTAIAQGLTRAAKIEVLTDQALAQDWQSQIAAITDPTFKTAALDALADVRLGAVAGAPGGAPGSALGGSGGGLGGGSSGAAQTTSPRTVPTSFFTYTASTNAASGVPTSGTSFRGTSSSGTGSKIASPVSLSK